MSNYIYHMEEKELENMNTLLLYISKSKYGSDWHSMVHNHHFTELFYVTNGKGQFLVDNEIFSVKENDMIIINPNVAHTEIGHADDSFEYIVLGIKGLQFENTAGHTCSVYVFSHRKEEIRFCMNTLLKEIKSKEEHYETICQNLLDILFLNIYRQTNIEFSVAPSKKITKECHFIKQYIDEHFTENITLQTLSELTYLNKYYLVHAFKNYNGTSPINYLIDKRIEESKHLLATTSYPVSKIAEQIGFSSQSYFSQLFRKKLNMTPNQYRKLSENTKEK